MNPPGNYNAAFLVVTLLVDGDTGEVLGEVQASPDVDDPDAFPALPRGRRRERPRAAPPHLALSAADPGSPACAARSLSSWPRRCCCARGGPGGRAAGARRAWRPGQGRRRLGRRQPRADRELRLQPDPLGPAGRARCWPASTATTRRSTRSPSCPARPRGLGERRRHGRALGPRRRRAADPPRGPPRQGHRDRGRARRQASPPRPAGTARCGSGTWRSAASCTSSPAPTT